MGKKKTYKVIRVISSECRDIEIITLKATSEKKAKELAFSLDTSLFENIELDCREFKEYIIDSNDLFIEHIEEQNNENL